MAELTHLHEPSEGSARGSLAALLSLGFRPLYLAGSLWAIVAVTVWTFAPQLLHGPMSGMLWHAHEMLWGFVATIAVGFLATAGANWTGINPLPPKWLGLSCGLWAAARVGFLIDHTLAFQIAAVCDVTFFVVAAAGLMQAIVRSQNRRNYALPWLLVLLALANGAYLYAVYRGSYLAVMQYFQPGLLVMTLVALLIARRVIPFFAMRRVTNLNIPMMTRSGQIQLVFCAAGVVFVVLQLPQLAALSLAAAGLIALWQLAAWRPYRVLHMPLLWILYLGYGLLAIGLLTAAAQLLNLIARPAVPIHVIAVGGFSVLIIGMITRTALGHLGRPLQLDRSMVVSYVCMLIAVVTRFAALLPSSFSQGLLHVSALAWTLCFALYLWRFTPMMCRPRLS